MKTYNFTPGPTPVPDHILPKMAEPILSHRSSEFKVLFEQVTSDLKYLFQTQNDVFVLTTSGSGAMESAVVNLLSPGDRVVAVRSGKFGGRWVELCEMFGMDTIVIDVPWGEAVDPEQIRLAIKDRGPIKAVFTTHSETSTGVLHDIEAIGNITHDAGCYLVVDAISGLGANDLKTDAWHVDMAVSGSQKGLMIPPGLAFITLSDRAWKAVQDNPAPSYYLSLKRARSSLEKGLTPYTPAVSLIMGLAEALSDIKKIGLDALFRHHERMAKITRAGVRALDLSLFAAVPSNVLTTVVIPDSLDGDQLLKIIKTETGVAIANGMEQFKGKTCRISHLGYNMNPFDMLIAISALEIGLQKLGYTFEPGIGVEAAQRELLETVLPA